MPTYVPTRLAITGPQISRILAGHRIQISPAKVGSGHVFHLTKQQHNKLRRHVTVGKGMRLQMTPHQIHHHMRHGRGFFDFIKKAADYVSPVLKTLAPILKPLAEKGLEAGFSRYGSKLGPLSGIAKSVASQGLTKAFGGRVLVGKGRRRMRRRRPAAGGSFKAAGGPRGGSFRPSGRGISYY